MGDEADPRWPNGRPGNFPDALMDEIRANLLQGAEDARLLDERWQKAQQDRQQSHPEETILESRVAIRDEFWDMISAEKEAERLKFIQDYNDKK